MIKVLMFGWEFPPYSSGGLGVACWGLTRALSDFDVAVTFVLPKRFPFNKSSCNLVFAETYGDISLRGVDTLLTPYITSEKYKTLRSKSSDGFYGHGLLDEVLRYAGVAGAIADDEPHDVIHAHDWLSFPAGMEAKRKSGKPLVVHVHATEFDRVGNGSVNQAVYDIEREGMHAADRIVAVSQFTKDRIVKSYGIDPEKVVVVHNGIDEVDFLTETTTPVFIERLKKAGHRIVLFHGRITLQKGPDYFVKAAQRVLEYIPDTYFVISGSGDMEGQMIQQVVQAGISDHVIFTGPLWGEERDAVYRSADLYVMPSVSEPFGITPLEAAIQSTPTLISKDAGVNEVLGHSLQVDFWDTDEMANKIVSVLSHNSLRGHLSAGARQDVKKIHWKKAAEKCIMLYKSLISAS